MRHLRALAAASLLVALAGCAESSDAGSGGAGHNEADVSFAGEVFGLVRLAAQYRHLGAHSSECQ